VDAIPQIARPLHPSYPNFQPQSSGVPPAVATQGCGNQYSVINRLVAPTKVNNPEAGHSYHENSRSAAVRIGGRGIKGTWIDRSNADKPTFKQYNVCASTILRSPSPAPPKQIYQSKLNRTSNELG